MNQDSRNEEIYNAYLDDLREYGKPVSWERIADSVGHIELGLRQMRRIARGLYHEREGSNTPNEINEEFVGNDDKPPEELQDAAFNLDKNGKTASANSYGDEIRSLEELLQRCGYYENGHDKLWRVKHHVVNVWNTGRKNKVVDLEWGGGGIRSGYIKDTGGWNQTDNWQVKAWFVPREEYPLKAAVDDIINKLKSHSPNYNPPKSVKTNGEYIMLPSLYDAHINKMSVDGSYTLESAVNAYKSVGETMIARALSLNMPVKEILYVVGQDALHADNLRGTTTYGTQMDIAAAQRRGIDAVCDAVIFVVERLATIAPVKVVTIEGNHDRYSTYWLGKVISAWFRKHPYVTVDELYDTGDGLPRKYYQYGNNLFGLDHGDNVRPDQLALTMAVEAPQQWAATKYREFLRGHFHKRTNIFHQVTEEKGVIIRVLPALCPPDQWHVMKGFIGNHRAADALFYHKEHGYAGMFPVFADELIGVNQ